MRSVRKIVELTRANSPRFEIADAVDAFLCVRDDFAE